MKKLFLLIGVVFLASCEIETPLADDMSGTQQATEQPEDEFGDEDESKESLAGTRWEMHVDDAYGNREYVFEFTSTHVTFSGNDPINKSNFTGTYTYDPPLVIISEEPKVWPYNFHTGERGEWVCQMRHEGSVEGDTMRLGLFLTVDEVMILDLKKQ